MDGKPFLSASRNNALPIRTSSPGASLPAQDQLERTLAKRGGSAGPSPLLQLYYFIVSSFCKLRGPYFMRTLMFFLAEIHRET